MIALSKKQIKHLHEKLLEATGGLPGVRDEGMLDSALYVAFQTFDGVEFYPSTAAKIARLAYGLICNHPFVDGNKRIGTYAMLVLFISTKMLMKIFRMCHQLSDMLLGTTIRCAV